MFTCGAPKKDGTPCGTAVEREGERCRWHAGEATASPAPATRGPVKLGNPSKPGLTPVGRTIKMLRPHCEVCEKGDRKTLRWWERCEHRPYITKVETPVSEPIIEEVEGERLITGRKTKLVYTERPNIRQVELNPRVNAGTSVERERRRGSILPEEYRSPETPAGFAPFCQYQDCWSQDIKVSTDHGDYCRKEEARFVTAEETGKRLELLNQEKRTDQLSGITV